MDVLGGLPAGPERDRLELDLQIALGQTLHAAKGWAAPETGQAFARARDLCRRQGEMPQLNLVLAGMFSFHLNRAEHDAARAIAEEIRQRAARIANRASLLTGYRSLGISALFRGEFDRAVRHLEQALVEEGDSHEATGMGFPVLVHPRVGTLLSLSWAYLCRGEESEAEAKGDEALSAAFATSDPYTTALALYASCLSRQIAGDRPQVECMTATLVPLAAEHGFPHLWGSGLFFQGWAMAASGAVRAGIEQMREGLAAKRATGAELKVPYYLGLLAMMLARAGQGAEAEMRLDEALTLVARTGEHWYEAELYRLRGEIRLASEPEAAEACFLQALQIARQQGAGLWEERARASLDRMVGTRAGGLSRPWPGLPENPD